MAAARSKKPRRGRAQQAARALDPDAPWDWSREDVLGLLTDRQRRYCETLESVFRIKDAHGRVHPYHMEPYQVWFHAHAPLALGTDAPDRLVEKGRGLGFTLMTAMDLLMLAHLTPRVHIPVAGRQGETSDEFVEKTWDLIHDVNADVPGFFDADTRIRSWVRLGHGSTLDPIPGGNPASIRSKRAPAAAFDEYAFHPYAKEIWRAGRAVLSEGGQLTVLSTHDGVDTHFYELVESARETPRQGFKLFYVPIHDPDAFDVHRSVSAQLQENRIRLVAPWLHVPTLDKLLEEDPMGYLQENLAQPMDKTVGLLNRDLVAAATKHPAVVWEREVLAEDLEAEPLLEEIPQLTLPERPEGNANPVYVGHDFAREVDFSAITAWELDHEGEWWQRWLLIMQGVDTTAQNALHRRVETLLHPTGVLIDQTGEGAGVTDHARRDLTTPVIGIHFASTVEKDEDGNKRDPRKGAPKVSIKKAMALRFAHDFRRRGAHLIPETHRLAPMQRKHLLAIRRKDLDAVKKKGEGHGDVFWACALAAWGPHAQVPRPRYRGFTR